jgi:hypothetical protein
VLINAVCGILIWNDALLIGKRLATKKFGGLWELPTAIVDINHGSRISIIQKFKDDFDINIQPFHQLRNIGNTDIQITPWCVRLVSGKAKLLNHSEIKFITNEEISKYEYTPHTIDILKMVFGSYSVFFRKKV